MSNGHRRGTRGRAAAQRQVGDAVDFEIEDVVPFGVESGQPARLTGIFHPAGSELTISKATRSNITAFGIAYEGKAAFSSSHFAGQPEVDTAGSPVDLDGRVAGSGLAPAFAAACARLGLIVLLFALAAVAWWWTAGRMAGMAEGPGTDLGALGWFLGVWIVMMAAMMFPSVAPPVALYARMTRRKGHRAPLAFAAGYLLTWTAAGLLAYGPFAVGRSVLGEALFWEVCLTKCRSSLGLLLGSWREGLRGALEMGARHGAWCVGCCWALMAALFALGVRSPCLDGVRAALIALEKTLPWDRGVTYATALVLLFSVSCCSRRRTPFPRWSSPGDEAGMGAMGEPGGMPMR